MGESGPTHQWEEAEAVAGQRDLVDGEVPGQTMVTTMLTVSVWT
jgi:hypothetical protein